MSFVATVPATNRLLTTVLNVRTRGSVPLTTSDETVAMMIASGSSAVERYTERVFAREEGIQTERIASCASRILLERVPVTLISVIENGVELDPTGYDLDAERGILTRVISDAYGSWTGTVTVTYEGGYVLPGDPDDPDGAPRLPADVEEATILMIGQANAATGMVSGSATSGGGTGIKRKSVLNGLIDITYFGPAEMASGGASGDVQVQSAIEGLLSRYRRWYV